MILDQIAQQEVQLSLYYIHFEIANWVSQSQDSLVCTNVLLIQQWADLEKVKKIVFHFLEICSLLYFSKASSLVG